tara:strand:+ start:5581 stop:6444 length:864 start_codon:yes stop_codon:yes gene_type:complete
MKEKIIFLIQSTFLNEQDKLKDIEAFESLSVEFKDFGVIPFSNEITNLENILEPNTKYITLCGIKALNIILNAKHIKELSDNLSDEQLRNSDYYLSKLKSSVFYNEKTFDQAHYLTLSLPLVNSNAVVKNYNAALNMKFDKPMFVKPTTDLKAFNGSFLNANETFNELMNRTQKNESLNYNKIDVLFSNTKKIYSEYRFVVIDGEVISGSRYIKEGQVKPNSFVPDNIMRTAKEYALLYQPSNIFVMDIADTEDGYEIMEYNCFNCSGMYMIDRKKVYKNLINNITL